MIDVALWRLLLDWLDTHNVRVTTLHYDDNNADLDFRVGTVRVFINKDGAVVRQGDDVTKMALIDPNFFERLDAIILLERLELIEAHGRKRRHRD